MSNSVRVFYPCMVCGLEFETVSALHAHTCQEPESDSDATDIAA